jgi:hypothetical protein
MLSVADCLEDGFIDGGKVVSLKHRQRSTPQKHFSGSGTHFCSKLSKPHGLVRLEELGNYTGKIRLLLT